MIEYDVVEAFQEATQDRQNITSGLYGTHGVTHNLAEIRDVTGKEIYAGRCDFGDEDLCACEEQGNQGGRAWLPRGVYEPHVGHVTHISRVFVGDRVFDCPCQWEQQLLAFLDTHVRDIEAYYHKKYLDAKKAAEQFKAAARAAQTQIPKGDET